MKDVAATQGDEDKQVSSPFFISRQRKRLQRVEA
jgi:hypothetical protein